MRRPASQWEQYHGKAAAELMKGSGLWPLQPYAVALEPPWDPFCRDTLTVWDCMFNDWQAPWQGSWLNRTFASGPRVLTEGQPVLLKEAVGQDYSRLVSIRIEQFPDDDVTLPKAEQLLLSLPPLMQPLSFEMISVGKRPMFDFEKAQAILKANGPIADAISGWYEPYTQIQFVVDKDDAPALQRLLLGHYANSSVAISNELDSDFDAGSEIRRDNGYGATLRLSGPYHAALRNFMRLDPDPLGPAIAAMEQLGRGEWAMLQILFEPAQRPWAETLSAALENPYKPGTFFFHDIEAKQLREKFGSLLFAVSVRIAAKSASVFHQLIGWADQFAQPPDQSLIVNTAAWENDAPSQDEREALAEELFTRTTHRPGMLLNAKELSSLVHLPAASVASARLKRLKSRTRPATSTEREEGSVLLGENIHQGQSRLARISSKLRPRHCYIAGASGTGKSTLLLNMIVQDIQAGAGVGLLDPHGDLVKAVLKRVPKHRLDDVILFDPADTEHPFALNILEAKDASERERIVAETVMALERYFPSSWGPRLERILTYTIYTALDAIPGATLSDVERMLMDAAFREAVIAKTHDQRFVSFWKQQFVHLPKNAVDPVLNKLSVFLLNGTVRNIIGQRHATIDFDRLLNQGKILLANLSTGLLTEKISGMFGSFLVTKLVNAAFRRAAIPEEKRRPWYLYIDEFQSFMNLSVGFDRILTEARKYRLVLAGLANQYVGQLSQQVRQAVFGNVATLVVFRLGVEDANSVARELGEFTVDEVLQLGVGQALVRTESAATAFNVITYPAPPPEKHDPTATIVARCRKRHTRPRAEVEKEIGTAAASGQRMPGDERPEYPSDPPEGEWVD